MSIACIQCQGVKEHCKDSEHYLQDLMAWKNGLMVDNGKNNWNIIAANLKALYPNIRRDLVIDATKDALKCCSEITSTAQDMITKLVMHCLNHSVIKFNGQLYTQNTGIITGENNSVTIANIALHYIVKQIIEIETKTKIFRRFIDDIIFITNGDNDAEEIKLKLTDYFGKYDLKLTYREITTKIEGEKVEFLDVLHCTNHQATGNFMITDFVKPTAINATFLNGKSAHPLHIFKGIILGEAKRLRRLNENDMEYKKSINRLKEKCLRSGFNRKILLEWTKKVENYENVWTEVYKTKKLQLSKENKKEEKEKMLPWATSFVRLLKPKPKRKKLVPNAMITYRRAQTLGNALTNYKSVALGEEKNWKTSGKCAGCGKCGLCGNWGALKNMVNNTDCLNKSGGKTIKIKQVLTCRDYVIYAA